jgi:hypothetical protein
MYQNTTLKSATTQKTTTSKKYKYGVAFSGMIPMPSFMKIRQLIQSLLEGTRITDVWT